MQENTATGCVKIADLSVDEKREIWLKRSGHTLKALAKIIGVTSSVLSRTLRNATMPVYQHRILADFGVPVELLPQPMDRKRGSKARTSALLNTGHARN